MKTIRKRKVAKANGMEYISLKQEYKDDTDYDNPYELNVLSGYGSVSALIEKPYTENFIEALGFLKSLNVKNGTVQ